MPRDEARATGRGEGFPMVDFGELPASTCVKTVCNADTTGKTHYGHCLHCGTHIGARSAGEWAAAVKAPCPQCGRVW